MSLNNDERRFQPGDHVRWYADSCGWKLSRRLILVEGDTDAKYFRLAADLYQKQAGLSLLGADLGVVAAGDGDEGGTYGIVEKFPAFRQIIQRDCDPNGKPLFRAIALVDNDREGNQACNYLTGRYTNLQQNRDVFVLQRVFPRDSREPRIITEHMKRDNAPWSSLDCEIEDLLSRSVLDVFVEENRAVLQRPPIEVSNKHHFPFSTNGKSSLCRWVPTIATMEDLEALVELIKSLRYYLGLSPEGIP